MNERIRELAEQAGYKPLSPPTFADELNEIFMRKFTELIVEECRYVMDCNKGSDQNPAWNQALSETSLKIKQHFGVER